MMRVVPPLLALTGLALLAVAQGDGRDTRDDEEPDGEAPQDPARLPSEQQQANSPGRCQHDPELHGGVGVPTPPV